MRSLRNIRKTLNVLIPCLLIWNQCISQESDSLIEISKLETLTLPAIYAENIKTVTIKTEETNNDDAVISLSSPRKLVLSFDDLNDNYTEYSYKLVHCNAQWDPTDTIESNFYESTLSKTIENYEFASATSVGYTHYTLKLPREYERFKRSGNYLIHVYKSKTDTFILTQRFHVQEYGVNINGNVSRPDDVSIREYKQQIKFELVDPKTIIQDHSKLYVIARKNSSWEFKCDHFKPSFVVGDVIKFERMDQCLFEGGNEYRYFNMIDFKGLSHNVARIQFKGQSHYQIWLDADKPRSFLKYSSVEDVNGRVLRTGDNKDFIQTELDYSEVKFSLDTDEPMLGYEIYLYGGLSSYTVDKQFQMQFNPDNGLYELSKLLKQGYYNYEYVVKSIYQDAADEGLIEGSYFDTENDYSVYVYYSAPEGYDKLIGYERLNSRIKLDHLYKNN